MKRKKLLCSFPLLWKLWFSRKEWVRSPGCEALSYSPLPPSSSNPCPSLQPLRITPQPCRQPLSTIARPPEHILPTRHLFKRITFRSFNPQIQSSISGLLFLSSSSTHLCLPLANIRFSLFVCCFSSGVHEPKKRSTFPLESRSGKLASEDSIFIHFPISRWEISLTTLQ